ncbi:MAG: GCN5-related N-acetyltransferase [Frankiales bacterium]|nr:GCN5-related N-acetyltransferase [Frankiales bacterium]
MRTERVDPTDERAFARWFAVLDAVQRDERPGEPGWLPHEQHRSLLDSQGDDPDHAKIALQVVDGDEVVAVAKLELPRRDNHHLVELVLVTHPRHRRRGAGRRLLVAVEELAREQGRTTIIAGSDEPPGSVGTSASRGFAEATGFSFSQVEVRRDIDLPLDPEVVARLERAARGHAADYALRSWRDRVPDDLVEDMAELYRRMSTDFPRADMELFEEEWDVARVRRDEEQARAMDRTWFGAGAVHLPTGRMVAYTEVGVPRAAPQRVYQWDTLVVSEHRGHRLGTLVKLACLQQVSAEFPQARVISTWNAEENVPMVRVNDTLGARVNGQLVNWQKRL